MSALRFAQSFARAIHSQKAHYLSRVSLEDRQVNVWRSESHFAFNDHNHTAYLQSFNQFWLGYLFMCRRKIDFKSFAVDISICLHLSEWHICIFCPILIVVSRFAYPRLKMTSTGYKRERNKKHTRQWEEPIIYSPRGLEHVQVRPRNSRPDFYKKRERAGGFSLLFIISYCMRSLHIITFPQELLGISKTKHQILIKHKFV